MFCDDLLFTNKLTFLRVTACFKCKPDILTFYITLHTLYFN